MKRAEGDVRSIGTGRYDVGSLQDKGSLGSGESTDPARDGVRLGDCYVAQ